ncbi:MAG: tetratricopeptide repeat protein [Acidobacteriota bacterium]|nr:tetratricopeptide repeat protein [Acidobacteriota bacterium]
MKFRTVIGWGFFLLAICLFAIPSFAIHRGPITQQQNKQQPAPASGSAIAAQEKQASEVSSTSPANPQPPPMTPEQKEEMRADLLMVRKMYPQAIDAYKDLLRQKPKDAGLLNKIGINYQELGDLKQAEHYYKLAVKNNKHFANAENNLGTIDFGRHKYKGAIKHFKKAVKIDPTIAAAFSNMGYAYLARKKIEDAILSFRQAILVDPNIFANRSSAGAVVEQEGNQPPGLFYYTLAKTFAILGNAQSCAHYLKMSRDEGYKKYVDAAKDPAFKSVLKDPRVQAILFPTPPAPSTSTTVRKADQ